METKISWRVTVFVLVLGMFVLAKQSSGKYVLPPESFPGEAVSLCLGYCVVGCAIESKLHLVENVKCLFRCLPQCRGRKDGNDNDLSAAANHYCHIGCSLDRCITDNPPTDAGEIGRCSAHCADNVCSRDYGKN